MSLCVTLTFTYKYHVFVQCVQLTAWSVFIHSMYVDYRGVGVFTNVKPRLSNICRPGLDKTMYQKGTNTLHFFETYYIIYRHGRGVEDREEG